LAAVETIVLVFQGSGKASSSVVDAYVYVYTQLLSLCCPCCCA